MQPDYPKIIECPHCKGRMLISTLLSGNTFGMTQWSDTRSVVPMAPSVSPVLKCPVCKKYFFYQDARIAGRCRTHQNSSFGHLSYRSLKEAFEQLQPSGDREITLRIMLLLGYNDCYKRNIVDPIPQSEIPAEERAYFEKNARRIIELIPDNKPFCAEIYRELGEFEQSIALLYSMTTTDMHLAKIVRQIEEHALRRDSSVFVLEGYENGWSCVIDVDDKMFVYNKPKGSFLDYLRELFRDDKEDMYI